MGGMKDIWRAYAVATDEMVALWADLPQTWQETFILIIVCHKGFIGFK